MTVFKHRHFSWRRLITSQLMLIAVIVIVFMLSLSLAKTYFKEYQVNNEIKELTEDIARLEDENFEFSQLLAYLKSSDFVEREARLNLGLKKPGEELLIIKDGTVATEEATTIADGQLTNPQKWFRYFFYN